MLAQCATPQKYGNKKINLKLIREGERMISLKEAKGKANKSLELKTRASLAVHVWRTYVRKEGC